MKKIFKKIFIKVVVVLFINTFFFIPISFCDDMEDYKKSLEILSENFKKLEMELNEVKLNNNSNKKHIYIIYTVLFGPLSLVLAAYFCDRAFTLVYFVINYIYFSNK